MLPCCNELEVPKLLNVVKDNFKQTENIMDFNCLSCNPQFSESQHLQKRLLF